jgi:hypothetical protein
MPQCDTRGYCTLATDRARRVRRGSRCVRRVPCRFVFVSDNHLTGTLPESLSGLSAAPLRYVTRRRRCDALPCRCRRRSVRRVRWRHIQRTMDAEQSRHRDAAVVLLHVRALVSAGVCSVDCVSVYRGVGLSRGRRGESEKWQWQWQWRCCQSGREEESFVCVLCACD